MKIKDKPKSGSNKEPTMTTSPTLMVGAGKEEN